MPTGPKPTLLARGLNLEYITLGWNVFGVGVLAVAAAKAHSVALAGFGLDSLIEILASVVVVWALTGAATHDRERRALKMIGAAFYALAVYVAAQGIYVLVDRARPRSSALGIGWTALTCAVMFTLAAGKGATGKALGNPVLVTESKVTRVDGILAGAVLLGLLLRATLGWWWADPGAGFVITFYGIKEGRSAWSDATS